MDIDSLRNSPVGRLVPISGHDEHLREFSHYAYLPDPLPSSVDLEPASWTNVAAAAEVKTWSIGP